MTKCKTWILSGLLAFFTFFFLCAPAIGGESGYALVGSLFHFGEGFWIGLAGAAQFFIVVIAFMFLTIAVLDLLADKQVIKSEKFKTVMDKIFWYTVIVFASFAVIAVFSATFASIGEVQVGFDPNNFEPIIETFAIAVGYSPVVIALMAMAALTYVVLLPMKCSGERVKKEKLAKVKKEKAEAEVTEEVVTDEE